MEQIYSLPPTLTLSFSICLNTTRDVICPDIPLKFCIYFPVSHMRATCLHHLMFLNLLTHKYFVNGTTYKDFRYYVSFPMSLFVVQVHLLEWKSKFDTRARAYKTRFEFDVFINLYRVLTQGGYTKIKNGKDGKAAVFQRSALTLEFSIQSTSLFRGYIHMRQNSLLRMPVSSGTWSRSNSAKCFSILLTDMKLRLDDHTKFN